jgi:hypothetical protein
MRGYADVQMFTNNLINNLDLYLAMRKSSAHPHICISAHLKYYV